MSKDYKILAVSAKQKHWESQFGKFITYYLKLEGEGDDAVEINKKEDSEPPKDGDVIHGDITDTQFGRKFKAAKKQFGGGQSYSKSPEDKEDIARAVALKAAVDLSAKDTEPTTVTDIADIFLAWLKGNTPKQILDNAEDVELAQAQIQAKRDAKQLKEPDEVYFPSDEEEVNLDNAKF